ncbi:MAG: hypothetical protein FD166_3575 [Bacteroidetes bacterium]|nr:MAG: hypothetical protein FD166_3575 [Bacteroidota bacterium]
MSKRIIQDDLSLATHVLLCLPFIVKIDMGKPEPCGKYQLVKIRIRHRWYIRWFGKPKQYDALATEIIYHLGEKIIYEVNGERHPPF